jgi:hypothetical protein
MTRPSSRSLPSRLEREDGAVIVLVAVCMGVLVLFVSLVVDVGHFFERKRHLQLQADAAALAAAQEFPSVLTTGSGCNTTAFRDRARQYGGLPYGSGASKPFNQQIGRPTTVEQAINSRTYPGPKPDPTDSTVNTNGLCSPPWMVDVKMSDDDVPWYFRIADAAVIHAHARVSINQIASSTGILPVTVEDSKPKKVHITFIDESASPPSALAETDLALNGSSNGNAIWDNSSAPLPVRISSSRIGVKVAISGGSSTTCGQPLVLCYDLTPPNGVLFIHGYDTVPLASPSDSPPKLRDARFVSGGTCPQLYLMTSGTTCTLRFQAAIDFGSRSTSSSNLDVVARDTVNGVSYPMSLSNGRWSATINVPPGSGPLPLRIDWAIHSGTMNGSACKPGNGTPCKGSFDNAQRTFSATDARSGPIVSGVVSENGVAGANSLERCSSVQSSCTHNLVVSLAIKGSLQNAQSVADPVRALRVSGGQQNQQLDCDPDWQNIWQELAFGCRPTYEINQGTACPTPTSALFNTPQPWQCVGTEPGQATNQVPRGLNLRILGDEKAKTCTSPNHWSDFPNLSPADPRIVHVLLTPFGSLESAGNGNPSVPVVDFATFYVTGWTGQGQGFDNPCSGNGDDPVPGNDPGVIVGHFIKYIDPLNTGGGTQACDPNSFGGCVAQLTE